MARVEGTALRLELVRLATLAPSSHNTQCGKFAVDEGAISILPDPLRRYPAVDPDDQHVFVSLACAAENLIQAALAHGLKDEAGFDATRDAAGVTPAPTPAQSSPLFNAIPARQCTRGDYDSRPIANDELALLERARTSVGELKSWIRFNRAEAVRTGDGLLQATALGIRNAFVNQPVEVPSARPPFATAMGLGGQRPDLAVRFGCAPVMPLSMRRPVQAMLA